MVPRSDHTTTANGGEAESPRVENEGGEGINIQNNVEILSRERMRESATTKGGAVPIERENEHCNCNIVWQGCDDPGGTGSVTRAKREHSHPIVSTNDDGRRRKIAAREQ